LPLWPGSSPAAVQTLRRYPPIPGGSIPARNDDAIIVSALADPGLSSPTITIVIADDHQVVRAGLRLLLEAEQGFAVVAEAGDTSSTVRLVALHRPRVLILDLNMPGGSSLSEIPRIRETAPDTRIVVLTMQNEPAVAREALRSGAKGYVLKEAAQTELVQAVRLAAEGRTYLNPELGARLAAEAPGPVGPPDDLSPRELEVLRLIALGHTNGEIATRLYLSVRTVESHRAHIQQKTRRTSRADLVAYARQHGLL
jgi:two-component system, NarL family, response regulator NreC